MFLWVKRNAEALPQGELIFTFDPPETTEEQDWDLYTTRDRHYENIAKELEKQAVVYDKQNDHRAARVAKDLATTLRKKTLENVMVN